MNDSKQLKNVTAPIDHTYSVGRRVVAENGDQVIERQDRQVVASLTIDEEAGAVFHRGARIA